MSYLTFSETQWPTYALAFLVPVLRKEEIQKEYLDPFQIPYDDVIALDLHYSQEKKKTPAAEIKAFIESELVQTLTDLETKYLIVADSDYFKILTKTFKVDANLGYVLPCVYGPWEVVYVPNYRAVFYDPLKVRAKISQGMTALTNHISGSYQKPGHAIIKYAEYPKTNAAIADALQRLIKMNCDLSIDIEAFDLKHHKAGIGTISFCWNRHEGIAFPVDYMPIEGATEAPYGVRVKNTEVRNMLRIFFEEFKRKTIYHNISYDVCVLIYQLFMVDLLDTKGLLFGIDHMLTHWDDTKLITYLATNSCAGNKLSLKDQAQEYAGNYAKADIVDITKIPLDELLEYNLIDGLSTWYVHEKYWDKMVAEDQLNIYNSLFQPAIVDIIQMQLTGMPINMLRVREVKAILEVDEHLAQTNLLKNPIVGRYVYRINEHWVTHKNNTLKKKRVTMADAKEVFNPNSGPQLQDLLYNMLALPVISYTDTKQPSTDGDTLKALKNHTTDQGVKELLEALMLLKGVSKILNSFIPAMENAAFGPDGWHYLFGNFNLGGTVSGRLSSSDPNLQNLPANSKYAKLIKSCFQAPPGWLFCGLDFNSLEDRISALTTKDPNKLKVYTDGYDGHCLRSFAYFGEQMPDIVDTVESINSIESKYKPLRQESKAPTFALTYQGTWKTLVTNCGFSMEKAKLIEQRYHDLYFVSDQWVAKKLDDASKQGYITAAFGLRVRTPLLHQVIRGNSKTPFEAEAEGRTAGNALGQSWCLLNTRASAEFMQVVRAGPERLNIRPCAHIHDAQYMLVRDDIETVIYANTHLVAAVEWQEDPEIQHDAVKLGGEFSIFWPTWVNEISIPNSATKGQIFESIHESMLSKK